MSLDILDTRDTTVSPDRIVLFCILNVTSFDYASSVHRAVERFALVNIVQIKSRTVVILVLGTGRTPSRRKFLAVFLALRTVSERIK